jgi:hypothetical protein
MVKRASIAGSVELAAVSSTAQTGGKLNAFHAQFRDQRRLRSWLQGEAVRWALQSADFDRDTRAAVLPLQRSENDPARRGWLLDGVEAPITACREARVTRS